MKAYSIECPKCKSKNYVYIDSDLQRIIVDYCSHFRQVQLNANGVSVCFFDGDDLIPVDAQEVPVL